MENEWAQFDLNGVKNGGGLGASLFFSLAEQ
jgi:hypothetical protein